MNQILVVGNCAVDLIAAGVDVLPPPGGTRTVDDVRLSVGGCAANIAMVLSHLGVACDLVTRVGEDRFGSFLIDEFEEREIGLGGLVIDSEAPTPFTFVTRTIGFVAPT